MLNTNTGKNRIFLNILIGLVTGVILWNLVFTIRTQVAADFFTMVTLIASFFAISYVGKDLSRKIDSSEKADLAYMISALAVILLLTAF